MKAIILILLLFFFIRFVIRYVLPVARMVRQARKGLSQMQDRFNAQAPQQPAKQAAVNPSSARPGDYIDYEEVR